MNQPTRAEFAQQASTMDAEANALIAQAEQRMNWVINFCAITDRFFFEILGRMVRLPILKVETMAVGARGVQIYLYYNPLFVSTLKETELRWVLTHEMAHVVLQHITLRSPSDTKDAHLYNWAADLAVNSLFRESADYQYPRVDGAVVVLLPKQFGYPERLSMEEYIQMTHDDIRNHRAPNRWLEEESQERQFDCHDFWDANPIVQTQIREWVGTLKGTAGWNRLTKDQQRAISGAQDSEVAWNKILRHYYGLISGKTKVSTYKRPGRRVGYPWCGKKSEGIDRKLVAIDTSGSIDGDELAKFLAETNALAKVQPVDVITWSCGNTMIKPKPWNPRMRDYHFMGGGGTDPQPTMNMAQAMHYKEVIMLTDGGFSTPVIPVGVNFLWVITPNGTTSNLPENQRIVQMKEMK